MVASMFYEKLRELSDFRLRKRNEHKWAKATSLGERAGLFNVVYDSVDTIKCKLSDCMSKFIN